MPTKTVRETLKQLTLGCGDIDEPLYVKLVRRDSGNNDVVFQALVPIAYFDAVGNICIEESDIDWVPYDSNWPQQPKMLSIKYAFGGRPEQTEKVPYPSHEEIGLAKDCKLEAIKRYKDRTGLSLLQSKCAIEQV